jgi:hypothetical protein
MSEAFRSMVPGLAAYDGGPTTSYQAAQPIRETPSLANASLRGDGIQPHPAAAAPLKEDNLPAVAIP